MTSMPQLLKPTRVKSLSRTKEDGTLPCVMPVFRSLGIVGVNAHSGFKPHQHFQYEVILVDRGTYICRVNHTRVELKANQGIVVKPGDWHEDDCWPPLRYFGVTFTLQWYCEAAGPLEIFRPGITAEEQCFSAGRKHFRSILLRLKQESESGDRFSSHLQDALLQEFFWRMIRCLREETISPVFRDISQGQGFATAIMRLFEEYVTRSLDAGQMAESLCVSRRLLTQRCNRIMGMPPIRAFMRFKIERARTLLCDTEMSVKEVSTYLGFSNQYHFSKVFKRITGLPPSACR